VKEASGDEERVWGRDGCWRIRRKPEIPRPCSCSGITGDIAIVSPRSCSMLDPASIENRILVFSAGLQVFAMRFPVLRFFGSMSSAG